MILLRGNGRRHIPLRTTHVYAGVDSKNELLMAPELLNWKHIGAEEM